MIVKDKEATILKADEVAGKLLLYMLSEFKSFSCPDDPAEQIYLGVHTLAGFFARVCISLDNYGKIYGIQNMDAETICLWVNLIAKETIKLNKESDADNASESP